MYYIYDWDHHCWIGAAYKTYEEAVEAVARCIEFRERRGAPYNISIFQEVK